MTAWLVGPLWRPTHPRCERRCTGGV